MRHIFLLLLTFKTVFAFATDLSYSKDTVLMGVSFSFTAVGDGNEVRDAVDQSVAEVVRIERLISSWDAESETSSINRNAGIKPVQVSDELFYLIQRAKRISELSQGYFDISFASIHKVWDFVDFSQDDIPSQEELRASVKLINYKNIRLNEEDHSVFLTQKGMKIGFGAIGKGYAANRAKLVMQSAGAKSGVVNAGGDVLCWGNKLDGSSWNIGILDPKDDGSMLMTVPVNDAAVVTSGNYKKFIEIDGVRYCHIINPKTGWPVQMLSSVTVIAPDAEIADAMATTVFVLGVEDGIGLIDRLNGIECIVVEEDGDIHFSQNLKDSL